MIFVTGCKNPKACTLIVRGGTEHVVDELDRALEDALRVVSVAVEDKKFVAAGGAPEIELSLRLREYAATQEGRAQLAIEAFAAAVEIIPRTLAENAGLDPIDMVGKLRAEHESKKKDSKTFGLNVYEGKPVNMLKAGVVEPMRVKTQAIASAAEAAIMILRIDDVIAASKMGAGDAPEGMPGGGMGGMGGGMPPMM
jgi:Chaperonin GroEL (HSP60 family)